MTGSESYPYTQDSQDMLDSTNSDPDFINIIITGDESWVYGYDQQPSFSLQ
jgi:hypothetical protein